MALPDHGPATPLVKFLILIRIVLFIVLVPIVGISANFVSEIVNAHEKVPSQISLVLGMACVALFDALVAIPFFWVQASHTPLVLALVDTALLIGFIVAAVALGRPLSYLDCGIIGDAAAASSAHSAFAFGQSVGNNLDRYGSFVGWSAASKSACLESKAVWGLVVSTCILLATSVCILPAVWWIGKRARNAKSDV